MDLYQDCSYDAPGVKTGPAPGGHKFETQEQKRKTLKFFFSETRKCRALIFGMKHLLVDLYQDCSYDAPGVKTGLAPGVTSSKHRNKDGKLQNSSFLKLKKCRALIFGMWHLLVDLYKDDAPKVKTGLAPGVTSSKHRNKQGKLQNSSSLKLESAEL